MSGRAKLLLTGVVIVVAIILILSSTYKVKEYEQAILLQFGEPIKVVNASGTKEPGLYLKTPFVQNVEYFEKRNLDYDAPAEEVILGDQKRLVVDSFATALPIRCCSINAFVPRVVSARALVPFSTPLCVRCSAVSN